MAKPSDWDYVPGSNRRLVRAPDGSVHSRQVAENAFAQRFGFRNEYQHRKALSSSSFKSFTQRKGYERGLSEAKANGLTTAEARAAFANYYANEDRNARDRSPDGPLARMLVAMGRRSPNETVPVGESPGGVE